MGIKIMQAEDFVDILSLKSDLIYAEDKELIEYYKEGTIDDFIVLIHVVDNLLNTENGVFAILTDEITNKLYKIINIKRFEIAKTHPEEFDLINDIITRLNRLNSLSLKQKANLRSSYLIYQSRVRNLGYTNFYSFLDSLGVDSCLLDYFNNDEEALDEIPYEYIIGSIFYLQICMPDLFTNDDILDKTSEILTEIENSGYRRISKRKIEKVKKKVFPR